MLSQLARVARELDLAAFQKRYEHPWVVWEPGPWMPPQSRTQTLFQPAEVRKPTPPPITGQRESLAMSLVVRPGRDGAELGRDASCELVIADATVSSRHVRFLPGSGGWTVTDLGSTNGSFVGGQRIDAHVPCRLGDGMGLQVGSVFLTFHAPMGLWMRLRTTMTPTPVPR